MVTYGSTDPRPDNRQGRQWPPLQGGHNVIGRATIDYELKEAYQPSNFSVGHMVFRLEAAAARDWRRGLIKLHADNAEEPGLSGGHWGDTLGLTERQKN